MTVSTNVPRERWNQPVGDELDASRRVTVGVVTAEPGVELWVVMIPEGDAIDRCSANLGGTYRYDGTRVCVVTNPGLNDE